MPATLEDLAQHVELNTAGHIECTVDGMGRKHKIFVFGQEDVGTNFWGLRSMKGNHVLEPGPSSDAGLEAMANIAQLQSNAERVCSAPSEPPCQSHREIVLE